MTTVLAPYGRALRGHWRWLMWGILLALAATIAVLILRPPLYRSSATVFVRTPGDVSRVVDGGDSYAQARAETYAALAKSTGVTTRVIADLGLDLTPESLSERIEAAHQGGTALIDVAANAPSPDEAHRTTTALITELSTTMRSLESVPGSLVPRAELVVVNPPSQPVRIMAWGVPILLVALGAVLIGLVLGAFGAVVRSLNEPLVSEQEYEEEDQDHELDTPATTPMPAFPNATADVLVVLGQRSEPAIASPGRGRHRGLRRTPTKGNGGDA